MGDSEEKCPKQMKTLKNESPNFYQTVVHRLPPGIVVLGKNSERANYTVCKKFFFGNNTASGKKFSHM